MVGWFLGRGDRNLKGHCHSCGSSKWKVMQSLARLHSFHLSTRVEGMKVEHFKRNWPSPTTTDTFDRYDVPIGGITWYVKDGYFQKSSSAKQSSW
jgi:hypothetical protein